MLDRIIGDEFRRAGLGLERRDGDLRDFRRFEQDRFDLGQFDAVAPQLDLGVDAAEILDLPVRVDAPEIAGAIDAARRIVRQREKIVDELRRSQFGSIEIAFGDADSGNPDFPRLPKLERNVALRIQDRDRIGGQRPADRHRLAGPHDPEGCGDRGFRRAIAVEQDAPRAAPTLDQRRRTWLPADQQDAQFGQIAIDRREQGRHAAQTGDVALLRGDRRAPRRTSSSPPYSEPASRRPPREPRSPRSRNRRRPTCPDRRDRPDRIRNSPRPLERSCRCSHARRRRPSDGPSSPTYKERSRASRALARVRRRTGARRPTRRSRPASRRQRASAFRNRRTGRRGSDG